MKDNIIANGRMEGVYSSQEYTLKGRKKHKDNWENRNKQMEKELNSGGTWNLPNIEKRETSIEPFLLPGLHQDTCYTGSGKRGS